MGMLQKQAYPFKVLDHIDKAAAFCMSPMFWLISELLSCILTLIVYNEQSRKYLREKFRFPFIVPFLYLVVLFPLLPIGIVSFFIYCLLQQIRQPYRYHGSKPKVEVKSREEFSVASANVCLCSEFISVFNSMPHVVDRTKSIAQTLIRQQQKLTSDVRPNVYQPNGVSCDGDGCGKYLDPARMEKEVTYCFGVDTAFPALDVICLQEVFNASCTDMLIRELSQQFPHILYDVGKNGWRSNRYGLSSGLLVASVYPFVDVSFQVFDETVKFCKFASLGLLMCKVFVEEQDGRRKVGYVANTHLQSYQGDRPVIKKQLDQMYTWLCEFRHQTLADNEDVLFDVVCGDFNMDNMSPVLAQWKKSDFDASGDQINYTHPLFEIYVDACRVRPGLDHDWAVGTERRQKFVHYHEVQSPQGLLKCLKDPYLRRLHVNDANIHEHNSDLVTGVPEVDDEGRVVLSPVGGKRRIDYVLYRKHDGIDVKAYRFVTQFASTTDHIPVCLTFTSALNK